MIDGGRHTPNQIREKFDKWRMAHQNWLKFIATPYVKDSDITVQEYLDNLCALDRKWDELGLVILSRMFRTVICILMNQKVWTVAADNNLEGTDIFVAFTRHLMFEDTCPVNTPHSTRDIVLKE